MSSRNGCGCCCACICSCIGSLIGVAFIVLIYWAIFQPHHIRATVESATLTNLTVVSSNAAAVSYNLTVTLSFYNPSLRVNIYYDAMAAELRFRDAVLGPAANSTSPSSEFLQRRKTSDDVRLQFGYGGGVAVAGDVAGELEKEIKAGGPVGLELDVDLRVRYVLRVFKVRQKPRVWCQLSIPVKTEGPGPGVGGAVAPGDRCTVKY
nr:unnamed protein product [Digitaria exilis]